MDRLWRAPRRAVAWATQLGVGITVWIVTVGSGCTGNAGTAQSNATGDASADASPGQGDAGVDCGTKTSCGGACVDTSVDPTNCGTCGTACNVAAGEVCSQGRCGLDCAGGTTKCGTMCANTATDNDNCGTCGNTCGAGTACSGGHCATTCVGGETLCTPEAGAPYCANLMGDGANCGACGKACTGGLVCNMGTCSVSCPGTEINCNGTCVDPSTSPTNCGATAGCGVMGMGSAGVACAAGTACVKGACDATCAAPLTSCNNACVDPRSDPNNCGGCNKVCGPYANGVAACVSSACTEICNRGFLDCSGMNAGCTTNGNTDNDNCGACGNKCTGTCISGRCTTFVTSPAPAYIPGTSGCDLYNDLYGGQVSIDDGGTVYVVLSCSGGPELSKSTDYAVSFSPPQAIPGFGSAKFPKILARGGDVWVLAGFSAPFDAKIVHSADGGATWDAPVTIGSNFGFGSATGSAVTLAYDGSSLFATWAFPNGSAESPYVSSDKGVTWKALPTLSGAGNGPKLFFNTAGDLVSLGTVNGSLDRLPMGAQAWIHVGNVSAAADAAAGNGLLYAGTTYPSAVRRASIDDLSGQATGTTASNFDGFVSMDADAAGNLSVAFPLSTSAVVVYSWPAGGALDAGTTITLTSSFPSPATAAIPVGLVATHGSVTAIDAGNNTGIGVYTKVY